ncbi:homoserine kinase [bacterium]|nr:MAG: homoserine kinase [bacterium]
MTENGHATNLGSAPRLETAKISLMLALPSIQVRVPATSANLGPGFDSLGLALTLYNRLGFEIAAVDGLTVTGEGQSELGAETRTIAHAAAHRVFQSLDVDIPGVHLTLENHVPLARGLGSSSAAIVAGLFAANEWSRQNHDRALSPAELLDLATDIEGHPDNVAPALLGGLVVSATGDNGHVSAVQVPVATFPRFAVWIPEIKLETKTARGVLPDSYSRADAIFNLSRSALLVAALATSNFEALREALRDKIHQDYRAPLVPGFETLSQAAMKNGALGVTLSGAGPSILFWLPSESNSALEAVQKKAIETGVPGRVVELSIDAAGCSLL